MPHIPRAFCVSDATEMVIERTGVLLETIATWGSYYKVYSDQYKCPVCEESVFLPATSVLIENFQEGYNDRDGIQVTFVDSWTVKKTPPPVSENTPSPLPNQRDSLY